MIIWENRVSTAPALETMIAITALFIEAVKTAPCVARIIVLKVWMFLIVRHSPLENDNPRQLFSMTVTLMRGNSIQHTSSRRKSVIPSLFKLFQ